jgi:uncharacterized protein
MRRGFESPQGTGCHTLVERTQEQIMIRRLILAGALAFGIAGVSGLTPSSAQNAPDPAALAASRELISAMQLADQFKAVLPNVLQAMKPVVAQGRPEVERDLETLSPVLLDGMMASVGQLADQMAELYARNFTVAELNGLTAFYRSPIGQKLLEKTPGITQQTLALGQAWGRQVATDLQGRMTEELRKRGKL